MVTMGTACRYWAKPIKGELNKYCSNRCQFDYQHQEYIRKWKAGLVSGNRGHKFPLLSAYLKQYLLEKYGERCCQCGWNQHHPLTGKVPLEVNHLDGDHTNNAEENLQLLCPNCHSLTVNFRNLNKGKGREYRRKAALQGRQ
jgi:hypothetical protein